MNSWEKVVVTTIQTSVYVPAGTGTVVHNNRPFHGFVLNEEQGEKDYCFSDGKILKTRENELFYLPKGSSYYVKSIIRGGCYAINFDAEISAEPFTIKFRDYEKLFKIFKNTESAWRKNVSHREIIARKGIYDIILNLLAEQEKKYIPGTQELLIAPAVKIIENHFNNSDFSIAELSRLCGISEAYFRRIFLNKYGVSPKEYVINLRVNYAMQLLETGDFSVSEVASLCGYSEPCHFSREFTKRTGQTPSQYRG